jgi:hypothetical protein
MFLAALFMIAQKMETMPSTDEWLDKMWYSQTWIIIWQ